MGRDTGKDKGKDMQSGFDWNEDDSSDNVFASYFNLRKGLGRQ